MVLLLRLLSRLLLRFVSTLSRFSGGRVYLLGVSVFRRSASSISRSSAE